MNITVTCRRCKMERIGNLTSRLRETYCFTETICFNYNNVVFTVMEIADLNKKRGTCRSCNTLTGKYFILNYDCHK